MIVYKIVKKEAYGFAIQNIITERRIDGRMELIGNKDKGESVYVGRGFRNNFRPEIGKVYLKFPSGYESLTDRETFEKEYIKTN